MTNNAGDLRGKVMKCPRCMKKKPRKGAKMEVIVHTIFRAKNKHRRLVCAECLEGE